MQNQNSNHKTQNPNAIKEKIITIDAELELALGELATYLLLKGEDEATVINVLEQQSQKANRVMSTIVRDVLRKKRSEVKLKKLEFDFADSESVLNGVAYFKATLEGTEEELRKVADEEDKIFTYNWEEHQHAN